MNLKKSVLSLLAVVLAGTGLAFGQSDVNVGSASGRPDAEAVTQAASASGRVNALVSALNGTVTISQTTGDTIAVLQAVTSFGAPGGSASLPVQVTTPIALYGTNFDVQFDRNALQLTRVDAGSGIAGLIIVGRDSTDLVTANAAGSLTLSMIDTTFTSGAGNPIPAGQNRQLVVLLFAVAEDAAGDSVQVSLTNAAAATIVNDQVQSVAVVLQNGWIKFAQPGDVDGTGIINIFDLLELLRVLGGSKPASGASDVDVNGVTNIFDLLALLRLLAG